VTYSPVQILCAHYIPVACVFGVLPCRTGFEQTGRDVCDNHDRAVGVPTAAARDDALIIIWRWKCLLTMTPDSLGIFFRG
jgi:hypothetical protein